MTAARLHGERCAYTPGAVRALRLVVLSLAAAAVLLAGCGGECRVLLSGGLVVGCGDEPPGPGDPDYGAAAQVLVKDCEGGAILWIGIAAPTPTPAPGNGGEDPFAQLESLRCEGELEWIGGTVRVADDRPNGFIFDPEEIVVLPASAPENLRTTIAAIAADPDFYAPTGAGGEEVWVVPATLLAIETTEPLACPLVPAC